MNVVLFEPEIPSNTGNIVRTCAATGINLHLVGRLGFSLKDKYLKRAGLDYWELSNVFQHDSLEEFWQKYPENYFYYFTKKSSYRYSDIHYTRDDFLVFGKETEGLPEDILKQNPKYLIKIPKREEARSLNLANAVSIVVYEALRQLDFDAGIKLT